MVYYHLALSLNFDWNINFLKLLISSFSVSNVAQGQLNSSGIYNIFNNNSFKTIKSQTALLFSMSGIKCLFHT